ncbi:ASCH domain-containing protein [Liquorilactobacillus mali]|uniref:ASCH domain-containing protein n=1 Tax=Liquorilactobacillus mali TaxID=1618 RepID=UPI0023508CC2|nr:ASCH domain-containing protein [Liquorilactobacillus mali]MDC7952233.1 ASCH protein [Liquorilactobacillus mali]MDN7145108.1 ASCH protein [Liquorilactobacillus mali]MDV7757598.1 ASCH protein [Liquorilactobacillus mali]
MDISLGDELFDKISNGTKTVEVFLNDEQMKHFGVGDTLAIHRKSDNEDVILTSAWSIKKCRTMTELYQRYTPEAVGMAPNELSGIYDSDTVKKQGLLAVKMKVLRPNYE